VKFTPSPPLRTGLSGGEILPLHCVQGQNDKGEWLSMIKEERGRMTRGLN